MAAALALAARGRGAVEPNPMVGAVIVRDGRAIAEGSHRRFGGPHAEVEALGAAAQAGADVRGATMYVTLEPCCHHGKTPPCTEAIVAAGIGRVVVAMADPDPHVAGSGLAALRAARVTVGCGVMEAEACELLAAYVKLRTTGRPWVICKWAQTADGYLALPRGCGRWISGEASRRRVHEIRGVCSGVLVGVGTVLADDPLLTSRGPGGAGRLPARIVLDSHLRTPVESKLVRTAAESYVVVVTTAEALAAHPERAEALHARGAMTLPVAASASGVDLPGLLDELGRRQWTYLLVEGGAKVLASFIDGKLADELIVFVCPQRIGKAGAELPRFDIAEILRRTSARLVSEEPLGDDRMLRWRFS